MQHEKTAVHSEHRDNRTTDQPPGACAFGLMMESDMELRESITTKDFCRICGVTGTTAEKWRRTGIGPRAVKVGNLYLYREDETLEFAAERFRRKLRKILSQGIVGAMCKGRVDFGDVRAICKSLGYATIGDLDQPGIESLIKDLNALAAQRPRHEDSEPWKRKPKPKAARVRVPKAHGRPKKSPKVGANDGGVR